jgi:hypothetical protein
MQFLGSARRSLTKPQPSHAGDVTGFLNLLVAARAGWKSSALPSLDHVEA